MKDWILLRLIFVNITYMYIQLSHGTEGMVDIFNLNILLNCVVCMHTCMYLNTYCLYVWTSYFVDHTIKRCMQAHGWSVSQDEGSYQNHRCHLRCHRINHKLKWLFKTLNLRLLIAVDPWHISLKVGEAYLSQVSFPANDQPYMLHWPPEINGK